MSDVRGETAKQFAEGRMLRGIPLPLAERQEKVAYAAPSDTFRM